MPDKNTFTGQHQESREDNQPFFFDKKGLARCFRRSDHRVIDVGQNVYLPDFKRYKTCFILMGFC